MNRSLGQAILLCSLCLLFFTGCTDTASHASQVEQDTATTDEDTTTAAGTLTTENNSTSATPDGSYTLLGFSPVGITFYNSNTGSDSDIIFIDASIGWKADYTIGDTHQENMTLFRTNDSGTTWSKLTSTYDETYTIPLATKTGFTFLDSSHGWIATESPQEGNIGLYQTSDGGYTWTAQTIDIPADYINCQFHSEPPTFFSDSDGILLNYAYGGSDEATEPLVYITHDKGESWIQLDQNTDDQTMEWTYSLGTNTDITWSVTYADQLWQSKDDFTWECAN